MYAFQHEIVILLMMALKVGDAIAKSLSSSATAHARAPATKSTNDSSSTSYYQYDPYGPNTYAFGFEVNDTRTGNVQFRDERRYLNGSVAGSYGYVRADGRVTVTRFLSDTASGYLSRTETFEANAERQWQQHWPTKKPPHMLQERPEQPDKQVSYDEQRHLNMTDGQIPAATAQAVRQQHGLDVNMVDLQQQLIDPLVLDIVNGKIPLQQQQKQGNKKDGAWGYETVHDFIPTDFPIVPFQLPDKLEQQLEHEDEQAVEEEKGSMAAKVNKYDKAKANNAEKAINVGNARDAAAAGSAEDATKLPASLMGTTLDANPLWYKPIIADARSEFLQGIPNFA